MIENVDKAVDIICGACSMALVSDKLAWAERQRRLERSGSSGKFRLAALAMHNAVRFRPQLVRGMLARPYEKQGIEVIGMGYTSTVVRMGDKAMKIIRASERMSEDEQRKCVKQLQSSQDMLLDYLGDYAIPQDFEITEHPLKPKSVVVSVQPYVEGFLPLRINNAEGLKNLDVRQKGEVGRFANKSYEMVDGTGWVPDMLGTDNFGFTQDGDSFVIVDTIPQEVRTPPDMSIEYIDRIVAAVQ
jgi:hypothetical protein